MRDSHSLSDLESNINKLLKRFDEIKETNNMLEERILEYKQKLLSEQKKSVSYKEECERIKVLNAMLGNTENKRLLKTKFNRIIKEVDSCIVELKTKVEFESKG